MYSLDQIKTGIIWIIDSPSLFFREINRLYYKRRYRPGYNRAGTDIAVVALAAELEAVVEVIVEGKHVVIGVGGALGVQKGVDVPARGPVVLSGVVWPPLDRLVGQRRVATLAANVVDV